MSYRLTAVAPCNIWVSGRTVRVEAGDRLHVNDSEGRQIINGPYSSRFVVTAHEDPEEPAPLAEAPSAIELPSPVVEEPQSIFAIPAAAAPAAPEQSLSEKNEEDGKEFMSALLDVEKKGSEKTSKVVASDLTSKLKDSDSASTVKSFLLDAEKKNSVTKEMLDEVIERFPKFVSIQQECKRLAKTLTTQVVPENSTDAQPVSEL